jgi:hypothetical protein
MGMGLILGGIGKGIADAGAAYGGGMSKMAEFEMQNQRDEAREQRQLRLADKLETQKEEKRATQAIEVEKRASEAPLKRDVGVLQGLAAKVEGESPVMGKEEMLKLIKDNPEYREVYRKAGLIGEDKMDPRLRQASDQESAAREVGVSSTMLESYRKAKTDTLTLIKEENKEKREETRSEQTDRRLDIMEQGAVARQAAADTKAKNAGADKPITGVDLERTAKAAERALALQLGVPLKDVPETVARLKKQNKIDSDTKGYLDEYQTALKDWQGYKRKPKDSADNATPAATTIPDLPKGAVQVGTSGGKPVYQTPDGKKFIGK